MLKKRYIYNIIIILIYLTSCILIYNKSNDYKRKNDDNKNIHVNNDNSNNKNDIEKNKIVNIASKNEDVIATIEIPKINLKENIYKISSSQEDVNEHVVILENSTFPVEKESILFIAAHSGNGSNAYFDKIDELSTGDKIKFFYKKHLYTYIVDKSFLQDKDGYIKISKTNKHELILTTCSTTDKNKQLVVKSIKTE